MKASILKIPIFAKNPNAGEDETNLISASCSEHYAGILFLRYCKTWWHDPEEKT
jgi:hypothetical protein